MEKSLAKQSQNQPAKAAKMLQQEMESIDAGLLMIGVGNAVRVKAFWNISRHKLYEAEGHKSMKDFAESTGYSYRRIKQLVSEGDTLAEMVFAPDVPEEKRVLTVQHVKQYVEAKKQAKLLAKHDTLRLPDNASVDELTMDMVESEVELRELAEAFASVKVESASTKQLTGKAEKKDKRQRELDMLVDTLADSAVQMYAVARAGGFGRAVKKKATAAYYARLMWWLLHNDVGTLPWVTFEEAEAAMVNPDAAPAHVRFAMGDE